jgi:hypothetical protein
MESERQLKDELFELVCFMLASARGLYDAPETYGPLRLTMGASRLVHIMEASGLSDKALSAMADKIDEGRGNITRDRQAGIDFLEELVIELAHLVKER